ncbi:DUF4245 domain-containing protein [Corynebacterium yudongzhengii]|uniref:DUF4245 domain-containing protein n=2 Tax=Corynebacterium yudongzhengii TaxID=2080740 RepID=A0A2U1T6L6_9CORY|nr:DUF4245 domain-containing protein [Corynebacterium yudongzhengii]PWC01661.1 DUF4245 domain-containing protein [Corynebacterium yudongzhengii]
MIISMAVIVVLTVAIILPTGLCTFNPGAPESGPVHEVDERTFLSLEAGAADYDLVIPTVPADWTANSARRTSIGQTPAPVVGYVTGENGFLQLVQTDLPEEEAVDGIDGELRSLDRTEDIRGVEVSVHTSENEDVRDLWSFTEGGVTYLINGVAADDEFATLIEATLDGEPVEN